MPHRPRTSPSWPCHHRPHKPHSRTSPRTSPRINPDLCFVKWRDQFYEQTSGAAMGSPLSPVLAELFMEEFELDTIENADLRPNLWLCYVDDTFVVWPHGKTALPSILQASTHQIHHGAREEQHHLFPGCSSHMQSRCHPCPHSTSQAYTHRPVSTQLFIPSSTLQVCCPQHIGPPCFQHLWPTQLEAGTPSHQDITATQRIEAFQLQPAQAKPLTRRTTTVQVHHHPPYIGHTSHKLQCIFSQAQIKIFNTAPNKIQASLQTIKSHNTVPQDIGFFINDIWSPLLKPTLPTAAHHNTDTLSSHTHPASNQLPRITGQTQPGSFPPKCASLQPYLSLSIISSPAFSWRRAEYTVRNVETTTALFRANTSYTVVPASLCLNWSTNFGCNWTSFHSKKNPRKPKMLTHWSEATRTETRNWRLF